MLNRSDPFSSPSSPPFWRGQDEMGSYFRAVSRMKGRSQGIVSIAANRSEDRLLERVEQFSRHNLFFGGQNIIAVRQWRQPVLSVFWHFDVPPRLPIIRTPLRYVTSGRKAKPGSRYGHPSWKSRPMTTDSTMFGLRGKDFVSAKKPRSNDAIPPPLVYGRVCDNKSRNFMIVSCLIILNACNSWLAKCGSTFF